MKLIDGFLYNGELEILRIRLELYHDFVDRFYIIEYTRTFTGIPKKKLLDVNADVPAKFRDKIHYIKIEEIPPGLTTWETEYYLRESILAHISAGEDDLIIISDVDEIINLEHVLPRVDPTHIQQISLPCYYYYYNVISSEIFNLTLIAPYKKLRQVPTGNRSLYASFSDGEIKDTHAKNGGHFTYQFGNDTEAYVKKIRSFSHQEYNNAYYLNPKRLLNCVRYQADLYDRWKFTYRTVDLEHTFPALYRYLKTLEDADRKMVKKKIGLPVQKIIYKWTRKTYLQSRFHRLKSALATFKNKFV